MNMADGKSREVQELKELGELELKIKADVSDALKGLKAVQREVRKTNRALKELEQGEAPLLKIEVWSVNETPEVYYKGERIEGKREVNYAWKTRTEDEFGKHSFNLEYVETDNIGRPTIKEIKEEFPFV